MKKTLFLKSECVLFILRAVSITIESNLLIELHSLTSGSLQIAVSVYKY